MPPAIAFLRLNDREVLANKLLFATAANERDSNNEDHCRKSTSNGDTDLLGQWLLHIFTQGPSHQRDECIVADNLMVDGEQAPLIV